MKYELFPGTLTGADPEEHKIAIGYLDSSCNEKECKLDWHKDYVDKLAKEDWLDFLGEKVKVKLVDDLVVGIDWEKQPED